MKITVEKDDGTTVDITELVRITYDVAVGSMDYSSGFLDQEEVDGLLSLAVACDFPSARDEAIEQWRARLLKGKKLPELHALCEERGVDSWKWHEIQPTDEELDAFLESLKAGR